MRSNIHPVEPEELMAYLDGELAVDRAAETAAHLQECRECQILAAELKSVSEGLTAWDVEAKEFSLNGDVAQALAERENSPQKAASGRRWFWPWAGRLPWFAPWIGGALAGGVVALLLAFTMIGSFSRGEHEASPMASRETAMITQGARDSGLQLNSAAAPAPAPVQDRVTLDVAARQAQDVAGQLRKRTQEAELSSNLEVQHAAEVPTAPMILRTAQLTVITPDLDKARAGLEKIVKQHSGYLGDLTFSAPSDGARKLTATLRVPAAQLDAALAELKTLGRVESESQNGQDVTAQYVDLEARLSNSRNTERRLLDLLRQRTGKLSDVLEVETELSRVREEIERMEGERRLLSRQVEFATLTATVSEEYKVPARALPDSFATRFRNAAVDGYQSVVNFVIGVALFLVSSGPMLLLWAAILFFPARFAWKKYRNRNN
jgi:anti-sigma factor RsiW